MEEIDIIELLQRVKEGKAPKEIKIENITFYYNQNTADIERLYCDCSQKASGYWTRYHTPINTKIKILDKPIIEELDEIELKSFNDEAYMKLIIRSNRDKINEIIRVINNKENKDE